MFKNSLKILLNNFSTVWKILLYKAIVLICVLGIATVVSLPIIKALTSEGFFAYTQNSISSLFLNFNLNTLITTISDIFNNFWQIVVNNGLSVFSVITISFTILALYFFSGLYRLPTVEEISSFMSSNLKLGFMNSYILNFGRGLKLQLLKTISSFIIDVLIIFIGIIIYNALFISVSSIAPLIAILFMIVMFALKIALLAGVETSIVVNNAKFFEAIKKNHKAISRKFISIFSNTLIILVLLLFLNMFALFFTFGVTFLITLPLSSLFLVIFRNVVYYECSGMRYYCDSDTIMMPKKLEEQDKFNKVKDII